MTLKAINPATGKLIAEYDEMPDEAAEAAVEAAHHAFLDWRRVSFAERGKPMREAARLMRARSRQYGRLISEENRASIARRETGPQRHPVASTARKLLS